MAILVSHAMHRPFSSHPPPDVTTLYSSCNNSSYLMNETSDDNFIKNLLRFNNGNQGGLSRSMRYADPWIYSTMASSSSTSNMQEIPVRNLCQCPNPKISKQTKTGSNTICKRCKAICLPFSTATMMDATCKFGTMRYYPVASEVPKTPIKATTVRGPSTSTSTRRPSIIPTGSIDPYDFMRRTRLTVPETNSTVSPFRSNNNEDGKNSTGTVERRSIMECNINPYQLIMEKNIDSNKLEKQQQQDEYENIDISNSVPSSFHTSNNNYKSILKKHNRIYSSGNTTIINNNRTPSSQTLSKHKATPRLASPIISYSSFAYSPLTPKKKVQFIDSDSVTDTKIDYESDNEWSISKFLQPKRTTEVEDSLIIPQSDNYYYNLNVGKKTASAHNADTERNKFQWRSNNWTNGNLKNSCDDKRDAHFYDTVTLRNLNNDQVSFPNIHNLDKLDGIKTELKETKSKSNPSRKVRPNCPPPPPPTTVPNKAKDVEVQTENLASIVTHGEDNENKPSMLCDSVDTAVNTTKESSSFQDTFSASVDTENIQVVPSVPPRKKSSNKQRQSSIINNHTTNSDSNQQTLSKDTHSANKTIVQVINSLPATASLNQHKIQIKNDCPSDVFSPKPTIFPIYETNENPQRKTSILINGDDCCYSTVNVNNDNVPLYQSSVVITDGSSNYCNSRTSSIVQIEQPSNNKNQRNSWSTIYIKDDDYDGFRLKSSEMNDKCSTFGVTVTNESANENSEKKSFSINQYNDVTVNKDYIMVKQTENEKFEKDQNQCHMMTPGNRVKTPDCTNETSQFQPLSTSPTSKTTTFKQLNNLLRNPVEAVRHDLVPHVCGKSDMIRRTQNISSATAESDVRHCSATTPSSPLLKNDNFGKHDDDDNDDEDNSSASYARMDDEVSEYYTDPYTSNKSSIIEDNDDNYDDDDDDDDDEELSSYQTKFYELLANDENVVEVVENSNNCFNSNHYYESIKANANCRKSSNDNSGDPIYEEIEIPPPLPSNPPPSDVSDLYLDKEYTTRSIFEGASKYDILSYLVDAKERGIATSCPEDEDYDTSSNYYHPYLYDNNNTMSSDVDLDDKNLPLKLTSTANQHRLSTISDLSEDNNSSLMVSSSLDGSINEDDRFEKYAAAEVERKDSGVGSETSKPSLLGKYRSIESTSSLSCCEIVVACEDCDSSTVTTPTSATSASQQSKANEDGTKDLSELYTLSLSSSLFLCKKCSKKRTERKEIIMELVETEEKYNKDLQIILEEFYQPMLVAGLLTFDQLSAIFLNVEELLENSHLFVERLRDAVDIALDQGDDDLLTVNIGKLFLDGVDQMLHTFEMYCVRQGHASLLLANLEKEKELLRIFLHVSQMENVRLRRMNLNSFLMVPLQRVTKYPLLIARLIKATPSNNLISHFKLIREELKEAQHKIELHLNHINSHTKDVPNKLWKKIGNSSYNGNNNSLLLIGRRSSNNELDLINIKLRKIAVDVLEWNHDEAKFILEGKLLFTQPTDNYWKKGRTIKLTPINALLIINGKASDNSGNPTKRMADSQLSINKSKNINGTNGNNKTDDNDNALIFPSKNHSEKIREAVLLLVRDKNGRYSLLREPLYLDRCIIAADPAWKNYFEVQEVFGKDTFIFKAEVEEQTHTWHKKLQFYSQGMGTWRKRRNALANIMINGMGLR